jgi:heme oxygenase
MKRSGFLLEGVAFGALLSGTIQLATGAGSFGWHWLGAGSTLGAYLLIVRWNASLK